MDWVGVDQDLTAQQQLSKAALSPFYLKAQLWKEKFTAQISNLNCSTFLFNFSALPPPCYLYPFLPLNCHLAYIYHDFATFTLAYSIHDATEEVTRKKMI